MMFAVLVGLTVQPLNATPQGRLIDRASFVISRGSAEIGREEVSIHQGRPSETGTGFVGTGHSVTTTAFYPPHRSYATAASVVQFDSDSQPSSAWMDLEGTGQPNVFVDFTARRITVRTRTSAGESASQYPQSARLLVVDDSLLSIFAALPGKFPGAITLFYPRTGLRNQAPLKELGTETTLISGSERQLRHWTLGSGDLLRHLWYDSLGRLMKIEMPSAELTAIRSPH
jgi:hypothetical protein